MMEEYFNSLGTKATKWLGWLLVLLSCIGINEWSRYPIGNTYTTWIVDFSITGIIVYYIIHNKEILWDKTYRCCTFFLIWALIGVIRGCFEAANYWEYKQLVEGTLMCSLPIIVYIFEDPDTDADILWWINRIMPLVFVFFFSWAVGPSCLFFVFPFALFYGCFFHLLSFKWKILVGILLVIMCLDLSARSNIIKVASCVAIGLSTSFLRFWLSDIIIKVAHWLFYGLAIALLCLGILGEFNVFEDISTKNQGKYEATTGQKQDLSDDTRSFIYEEVILSAVNNKYVLIGNTPARGNYSYFFYVREYATSDNFAGRNERHANELVHLNIFTWLGLVGLILYSIIYFISSYRAVYDSNSFYLKMIGLLIAFHWLYGWIEDVNTFTIQNFWIWMMIAMGLSPKFRNMTDEDFENWFYSIFQ